MRGLTCKLQKLKSCICLLFFGVSVMAWAIYKDLTPYYEYRNNVSRVLAIVKIGDDIDETREALIGMGYKCHKKHFSTVKKDKYWIEVTVATDSRPITLSVLSIFGFYNYFHYVVIESDLNGKITDIIR